jgi:hypothetical protein
MRENNEDGQIGRQTAISFAQLTFILIRPRRPLDLGQTCRFGAPVYTYVNIQEEMTMDQPGFDYHIDIPGTTIFDGKQAMKGYALNKMCYSFNKAENREAFVADEEAYMEKYGLNEQQKKASATATCSG